MFKPLLSIAALLPIILAQSTAQNVTAQPLPAHCSSYPGYNETTGIAGPWLVRAYETGNELIDGLQLSASSFTNDGRDRFGFVTLPRQLPRLGAANVTFRCSNSTLQALLPPAQFYPNATVPLPNYVDIVISKEENWQAAFGFNITPSVAVTPFAHFVDGKMVEGVFLGAGGRTRAWFRYNWGGNAGEYYLVRLEGGVGGLGMDKRIEKRQGFPALDDRDWRGYLRVV